MDQIFVYERFFDSEGCDIRNVTYEMSIDLIISQSDRYI